MRNTEVPGFAQPLGAEGEPHGGCTGSSPRKSHLSSVTGAKRRDQGSGLVFF